MTRGAEIAAKLARVRAFLRDRNGAALLLASPANFAWLTGGGEGEAALLVTPDRATLLCAPDDAERLLAEEAIGSGEWGVGSGEWGVEGSDSGPGGSVSGSEGADRWRRLAAEQLPTPNSQLLTDSEGGEAVAALREPLLPPEVERCRALGQDAALALTHACFHLRPGLSEHQAAGLFVRVLCDLGAAAVDVRVAADERAARYGLAPPTAQRIKRHVLLGVTARRRGLRVSLARAVHFGPAPEELRRRHEEAARLLAALLAATRPGAALGRILSSAGFPACEDSRAASGPGSPAGADSLPFEPGTRNHSSAGGPTGYAERPYRPTMAEERVREGQLFAWRAALPGVELAETILAGAAGAETISATPDLPALLER